jgi:hypothetical protein
MIGQLVGILSYLRTDDDALLEPVRDYRRLSETRMPGIIFYLCFRALIMKGCKEFLQYLCEAQCRLWTY